MKIFLSYGHDSNVSLIEKIYEYLTKGCDGSPKHDVWIDKSEIKEGEDWRCRISEGIRQSDVVLAGLSKYSTRNPGVCRDEISISVGVMGGNIKTILLEPTDIVAVPAMLSHIQWLDMSDWKRHIDEGFNGKYFQRKFKELARMINTPENEKFNGDINRLREKLIPISPIMRIKSLTQKRMYGRQWLYKKIEEWDKNDEQRIFWIVGGPGFGKSTFAANLQQTFNAKIPAIQFVEWGKPAHSDPCAILRNIAFQLAVRYHDYLHRLLDLPQLDNLTKMNEHELFDVLFCESMGLMIDGGHENIWILIDALDEANDANGNMIALTISRHIDRLPRWMKFILTSRDDKKVRLPLQRFKPQVFDLEHSIEFNNFCDIKEFVKSELSELKLTELQSESIVRKSEGVFLYAQLLVEDIKAGVYSIDEMKKIPNGINSYYYNLFSRIYLNDMNFYDEYVAKVLEIIVSSSKVMNKSLVKECACIESDRAFNKILNSFQHIIKCENDELKFFHHSVREWLIDPEKSGNYYVSPKDGMNRICNRFVHWLNSDDTTLDSVWQEYHYGFEDCVNNNTTLPNHFSVTHINTIFNMLCPVGCSAFGTIVRYFKDNISHMRFLLDRILNQNPNELFVENLFNGMFESVKDLYIEIGIVSPKTRFFEWPETDDFKPNGNNVYEAIKMSAYFCAIVECALFHREQLSNIEEKIIKSVQILAFYNRRLGEILLNIIPSLSDMADFTAHEMEEQIAKIKKSQY